MNNKKLIILIPVVKLYLTTFLLCVFSPTVFANASKVFSNNLSYSLIGIAICSALIFALKYRRTKAKLENTKSIFRNAQRNASFVSFQWELPLDDLILPNDAMKRLCCSDECEKSGGFGSLFLSTEDASKNQFIKKIHSLLNRGNNLNFSFTCRSTEMSIRADVVRDKFDNPIQLNGILRNKQCQEQGLVAVEEMEALKARLELILETAGIGIYGLDIDGNTTFANNATYDLTGYSKSQIIGKHQHELIHHTYPDGSAYPSDDCSIYKAFLKGEVQHRRDEIFWRKDGTSFPVEFQSTPMYIDEKIQGAVVVFADITKRKEQEQTLIEASRKNEDLQRQLKVENEHLKELSLKMKLILDSTSDGIYGIDEHGVSTFANQATADLTGWSPEEMEGQLNHDVLHHSYADGSPYPKEDCPIYKAFRDGRRHTKGDEVFWRKDGSSFPVEYSSNPIVDAGVPVGSVIIFRDITERIKAKQKLEFARQEIERLNNSLEAENYYLKDEIKSEGNFEEIIGESETLKKILIQVEQVAPTDSNVLILGESGTGKELIARAVVNLSPRLGKPLIKVNCAAVQKSLIENELFGHVKGAYTGADSDKAGRFELADGGTLFLDEIGELDIEVQAKLLRVLQEGEIERLGSSKSIKVDVRIISATNRDLEVEIANNRFREDLYYRLNIFPIMLPPLRERPDDIALLVNHLVQKFNQKLDRNIESIPQNVLDQLEKYSWPGNIRELQNVLERAVILSPGKVLQIHESLNTVGFLTTSGSVSTRLEDVERNHITKILHQVDWKVEGEGCAAALLDINPSTLRSRMKKLKITKTH